MLESLPRIIPMQPRDTALALFVCVGCPVVLIQSGIAVGPGINPNFRNFLRFFRAFDRRCPAE